jgi:hypothetical protein
MAWDHQLEVIFWWQFSKWSLNEETSLPNSATLILLAVSLPGCQSSKWYSESFLQFHFSLPVHMMKFYSPCDLLPICTCKTNVCSNALCYLLLCLLRTVITCRQCLEFWRWRLAFHCTNIYTLIYTPQDQQATDCMRLLSLPTAGTAPTIEEFPRISHKYYVFIAFMVSKR